MLVDLDAVPKAGVVLPDLGEELVRGEREAGQGIAAGAAGWAQREVGSALRLATKVSIPRSKSWVSSRGCPAPLGLDQRGGVGLLQRD